MSVREALRVAGDLSDVRFTSLFVVRLPLPTFWRSRIACFYRIGAFTLTPFCALQSDRCCCLDQRNVSIILFCQQFDSAQL